MMHDSHNLHFLAYAACMRGDFKQASDAAAKLAANVGPNVKMMPMLEGFLPTPTLVLIAFEKWDDILKLPAPDPSFDVDLDWHFARGPALREPGKNRGGGGRTTRLANRRGPGSQGNSYDMLNTVAAVFKVHHDLLFAALAHSRGDAADAIDNLKRAVQSEDALNYSEPPSLYPPVRPMLGRELMAQKQFAEAEKVLREDWAKSAERQIVAASRDRLISQNNGYEAAQVDQQYRAAWAAA